MSKIKLTCNWCDDVSLYKRFCRVYYSKYNTNPNFQFTLNSDFDFLVIINSPNYHINFPKEKTLGVIMEPFNSPSVNYFRSVLEKHCKHIIWHYEIKSSQYIYYPGLLPYHMDYDGGENLDFYIDNLFPKTKLCSFIVSYNENYIFPNCIYKERVNFAKQILKTDLPIDIFGKGWEQSNIKDSRIKGFVENKKEGLLDYQFSIAIENCVENNYFSEKLTDCILTNTIPIYFGCPNIEDFPFVCKKMRNISNLDYLKQILQHHNHKEVFNKKIMSTKYNLYTAIKKYFNFI